MFAHYVSSGIIWDIETPSPTIYNNKFFSYAIADCRLVQSECVYARKREQGAASRCNVERGHRWFIIKITGIKFVPTSEWQVLHRTEECAERTWERDSGAPLVPVPQTLLIIISNGLVSLS